MVKIAFTALVAAALFAVNSSPVQAQNNRSWVASNGLDASDCSRATPCLTFAGALAKTNAGGEINVVDSADYGAVTIGKSITIQNDGTSTAGIFSTATTAITINGSGITVTLRGLDINADGSVNTASHGISFPSGAALHVENCTIRNFVGTTSFGIAFRPSNVGAQLFVSDTVIAGNGSATTGGGIVIQPVGGGGSANAYLTRVQLKNNVVGLVLAGVNTNQFIQATISDSTVLGNTQTGILVAAGAGGADVFVASTIVAGNAVNGLLAQGTGGRILYANTTITVNGTGVSASSSGQLISNGTNRNRGNFTNGTPTSMQPLD